MIRRSRILSLLVVVAILVVTGVLAWRARAHSQRAQRVASAAQHAAADSDGAATDSLRANDDPPCFASHLGLPCR